VKAVYALGHFALIRRELEVVADVYAADDQDFALEFDLAPGLRRKNAFTGRDPARLQRATKGPG
jgi:hypothetical protein